MKRNFIYYPLVYAARFFPLLCSSLLLPSCGGEGIDHAPGITEGIPTEIGISLSTRICSPEVRTSRVDDGIPANPSIDNEKINDWFIVFVDRYGVVRKILKRSDAETKINSSDAGSVELETFRCVLPSGTYSIFAFANISPAELSEATGIGFALDQKISDLESLKKTVWKSELNNWDISRPLPMSGFLPGIKVENTIEETFSIEVVRMLAKVEFIFSNPTDREVTLHTLSLDPVTSSPVSLFPDGAKGISYDFLGQYAFTPVGEAEYAPLHLSLPTEGFTLASGETAPLTFYIKESLSERDNDNSFTVSLQVSHGQDAPMIEQHNITRDIRGYINRNDWISIPIVMSQYDVKTEAIFYPPIGGYPAYLSTTDPDGSQIFTFGTEGDFSILTTVTDKLTSTHLPPSRYRISLVKDASGEIVLTGDLGIFSRLPFLTQGNSAVADEITGTLSAEEGKCMLSLKTDIYDIPYSTPGAQIVNTYYHHVYIIRDNKLLKP